MVKIENVDTRLFPYRGRHYLFVCLNLCNIYLDIQIYFIPRW